MFGEFVGGAVPAGGQEKEWMGCLLDDIRAFGIETGGSQLKMLKNGTKE